MVKEENASLIKRPGFSSESGKLRRLITAGLEEGEYYRNYDLIKCRSDMQITLMNIRTDPL